MIELNAEQKIAVEAIKTWSEGKGSSMMSLSGYAGTGKSTLLQHVKHFFTSAHFCAMTGRAAQRLALVAGVKATTLHAVLYNRPDILKGGKIEFNKLAIPAFKYLIVDEASLINPKIYEDLKQWTQHYKTRILFVGDSFQLPPILTDAERKANDEFTIFAQVDGPKLTQIMRSGDGVIEAATIVREKHRIPTKENNGYQLVQTGDPVEFAINEYLADPDDHMLITWTNKLRMDANHRIRQKLGHTSHLPDEGEPVIFCRNGAGVLNGEIAIVRKIVQGPIIEGVLTYRILLDDKRYVLCSVQGYEDFMDGSMPYVKNWKNYLKWLRANNTQEPIPITYGYVSTAHKSQGQEFRRSTTLLQKSDLNNPHFNTTTTLPDGTKVPFGIRFLYTCFTRSKQKSMLITGG